MNTNSEYFEVILKEEFLKRQRNNSSYSLRAFARDIKISTPVLSQVFSKKRRIPKKFAHSLADTLELTPLQKSRFIESVLFPKKDSFSIDERKKKDSFLLEEERNYKIMAEWEHYALFSLMDTIDFKNDSKWIAKRLSITELKVQDVIGRLIEAGVVEQQGNGNLRKKVQKLTTTKDVPSSALRKAHDDELKMANKTLHGLSVNDRYFSSTTVAIDKSNLSQAKELYRDFRDKLGLILDSGEKKEVYLFGFQAFPLTDVENNE